MGDVYQALRSGDTGVRPSGRATGELYLNLADDVLGYVDGSGNPVDCGGAGAFLPKSGGDVSGSINVTINGTNSNPALSFGNAKDIGIYLDASNRISFAEDTVKVAYFDSAGTSQTGSLSIVTQEKGDARYLLQSGGVLTGALDLSESGLSGVRNIQFWDRNALGTTTSIYIGSGINGNEIIFNVDNTLAARIDTVSNPTNLRTPNTVVTRERGDNRYLRKDTDQTFTGTLTVSGSVVATGRLFVNTNGTNTNPSIQFGGTNTGGFYWDASNRISVSANTEGTGLEKVAVFDPVGAVDPETATSIVTREKGDVRYSLATRRATPAIPTGTDAPIISALITALQDAGILEP